MKPVKCSWVDMEKRRQMLGDGEHGDQARLEKMLSCVDQTTISTWKACADFMGLIDGKYDLSHVSHFQPTHARLLMRDFRKRYGKNHKKWSEEAVNELIEWVERVEDEKLTTQQLKAVLATKDITEQMTEACTAKDLGSLQANSKRFGTIYADPPWQYDNQRTRAATDNHYETMTVQDIADLPIAELAEDKAHLFLWTTGTFLPYSFDIIKAWGFEYKTYAVWVKPQIGIGNYFRKSTELLLFANRGGLQFTQPEKRDWFELDGIAVTHDRIGHSQKPEEFRRIIESVSPGPYLELFARRPADNWTVWGNEIEKGLFDGDVREV